MAATTTRTHQCSPAATGPHHRRAHYGVNVRNFTISDDVRNYATGHGSWPPDPVVQQLRSATMALGEVSGMQIGDDQGQLLTMLARLVGARHAVEVGTFTGYSALCIARGLAQGGTLLCCDISAEWTAIGAGAWQQAGVADRIELRIGPAIETLRALAPEPVLDLAFIDADKTGYSQYWDELVPRVRPGGLLLADNVLWSGRVADQNDTEADTEALRAFNDMVTADNRVEVVMLTAFDGLTIARKL